MREGLREWVSEVEMSAGCLKEDGIDARLVMLGFVHGVDPMEVQ